MAAEIYTRPVALWAPLQGGDFLTISSPWEESKASFWKGLAGWFNIPEEKSLSSLESDVLHPRLLQEVGDVYLTNLKNRIA